MSVGTAESAPRAPAPGFAEFVAMMAAIMALQALAVDAMLPALPDIGRAFGVADDRSLQWIVTAFVLGAGAGQLIYGPLSDWLGRRPVLLAGIGLYVALSLLAARATSLDGLIVLRVLQGIASAASGVIPRAAVRDRFEGQTMARVLSIVFMVFLLVPVLAPALGQALLLVVDWRGIFALFGVAGAGVALWTALRLPETLHPQHRRVPRRRELLEAAAFVLSERTSLGYTVALTLLFGGLLAYVSLLPQVFATTFQRPELMAATFALCAGSTGITSYMNSRIVERLGMHRISHLALLAYIALTLLHSVLALGGAESLLTFALLQALTLAVLGFALSNFGAIAMQPMGAIAGSAASIQGFISMVGGAVIAAVIGRQWSGSVLVLPAGALACGLLALAAVLLAQRGALFSDPTPGTP
jgi:DHA1 family bicyclomycin/chloramphenicol resistance-like MFS transporter